MAVLSGSWAFAGVLTSPQGPERRAPGWETALLVAAFAVLVPTAASVTKLVATAVLALASTGSR